MNPMANDELNPKEMLDGLAAAASGVNDFMNKIKASLTPEQRAELDKEMGKAQSDLSKAMKDISNLKF